MSVYVADCTLGRGVFAQRAFRSDEPIVVFLGEVRDDPRDGTAAEANLLQVGRQRYILPCAPAVFVNHSCSPNAGFRGSVVLRAMRPIVAGEEIRFDYSTTMVDDPWTMQCQCGSRACRRIVADFRSLPDAVRQRYLTEDWVLDFVARDQARG